MIIWSESANILMCISSGGTIHNAFFGPNGNVQDFDYDKIRSKEMYGMLLKVFKMIKIIMMTKRLRTRSSLQVTILGFNQAIFKALVITNNLVFY